jgi:hypothetical protein
VSRRRSYPDGVRRYYCRGCNDRIASLEERFGRRVEVHKVPTPVADRLGRELARWEHALGDPEDPAEVMEWIRDLPKRAAVARALGGG